MRVWGSVIVPLLGAATVSAKRQHGSVAEHYALNPTELEVNASVSALDDYGNWCGPGHGGYQVRPTRFF